MIQSGSVLSFDAKAADVFGRGQLPGPNHLKGHDPLEANLPGLVNDAHSAVSNFLQKLIITEETLREWRRRLLLQYPPQRRYPRLDFALAATRSSKVVRPVRMMGQQ